MQITCHTLNRTFQIVLLHWKGKQKLNANGNEYSPQIGWLMIIKGKQHVLHNLWNLVSVD